MRILELSISGTVGTHEMGPVSSVVCELANQFVAQGHEVCLVDARATQARSYLDSRVQVIDVDCAGAATLLSGGDSFINAHFRRWRHAYGYLRQTSALVDLKDYDTVHVHNPIVGYLLHRIFRQAYVLTCHNPPFPERAARCGGIGRLARRLMQSIDRRAIKHASRAVALGDYVAPHFRGASFVTIPNGIDLSRWTPIDKQGARRALGFAQQEFIVVFTGRISPVKGVDVLLDATAMLAPHIDRLRVVIVGSLSGTFNGRDRVSEYAQRIAERARDIPVEMVGFVNNKEPRFKEYLAAADVAVVPSRQEPQGLVVLEALAMGTPVVASDTGGISPMVDPQVGRLVPPEDASSLARELVTLYRQPATALAMSRRCRAHVESSWTWPQIAKRYLTALSESRQLTDTQAQTWIANQRRA